jgi:hypothetical protein
MRNIQFITVLLGMFLLIAPMNAIAQFIGFQINGNIKQTSFKFEMVNNLIIVPVVLNDSLTMNFILDTGVRTTLLTNENLDKLEVNYNRPVTISGLGLIRDIKAYVASNVTIRLPGITGRGQTLIVLGEDYLNLQSHIGKNVHGVLGYDFITHFVVKVDYVRKRVTVYDREHFSPPRGYTELPVTIATGRPYIEASFAQTDGSIGKGKFLLDSGASHSILFEIDKGVEVQLPIKTLQTIVGWGLGGEIQGVLGRVPSFKIGPFELKKVVVSFTSDLKTLAIAGELPRIGSIGGEVLGRFTTIYDYQGNKLYLKRNHQFRRGFEYNMSGIDVTAGGKEFKTFTISHIAVNSPAWVAGMKEGDVIVAINGKGAAEFSLEEINAVFRSAAGSWVTIVVMRNQSFEVFKLRLRRVL